MTSARRETQDGPALNILVLAYDVPATTSMPGSPRLFSLCRGLAQRHRLTLATRSLSDERLQAFEQDPASKGVFEATFVLPNPPAPNWMGRQIHRIRREAHFVTRYRNPRFHGSQCESIREMVASRSIDVVYADGLVMAQYVQDAHLDCPAIIDLHDSLSMLYARAADIEAGMLQKLTMSAEMRSIEKWERSLSRTFGAVITNSRVDEEYLRRLDPAGRLMTIGNGVDTEYFNASESPQATHPNRIVFTGVMNYAPNEDAAVYFCEAILPLIRRKCPAAEFWIVGKDPTECVQRLGEREGVKVTGGVPDVRPYVESSGVFVSPIRYGAGIKNKILAAMAMGKAVVATSSSIEGLDVRPGEHLLAADEPSQFAEEVLRVLQNAALTRALARSGQAFVRAHHSWESSVQVLEATVCEVADRHAARRSDRLELNSVPR